MDISVVVPTLNARERLASSLDDLGAHVPDAEVIVVNGPSADGTSGMVRDHDVPDILLELSERNLNASRNAGIAVASGDVIAFIGQDSRVREDWIEGVEAAFDNGADVATGPVHRRVAGGVTTESLEQTTIADRGVSYFDGGNVAFRRDVLDALDGFDEYLHTGAARDAAHRLAAMGRAVTWQPDMVVLREEVDDVKHRVGGDQDATAWGLKYRALTYRLAKNYGLRVTVGTRTVRHALRDAVSVAFDVARGDEVPSTWIGNGKAVITNTIAGVQDGLTARVSDRSPRRNPNGVSSRMNRAVARYDL